MTIRRADVCIIGGGLVGCSTALFLAGSGHAVIVIEKGAVGREASGVNFGNLRLQGRKPEEFPLSLLAHDLWERFEVLTGESCAFQACGHAYIALAPQHLARLEQYAREAQAAGINVAVLGATEVGRRWPSLSPIVVGAIWSPRDAVANPELACPAVARAAERQGAVVIDMTGVTRLARTATGFHLSTDRDLQIECRQVVNAAGAWAGGFASALQEPVPMFAAGPPIIATAPVAPLGLPSMFAVDGSIIFRQTAGGVLTSSFPRQSSDLETGYTPITPERIDRDLRRLADVVPALAGIEARHAWSGVEGYLPDMLPVIGESRTTPGVFHAFGFSGHGYQLSLGVGRVIADLVLTGRSDIPIAAFDIGRFTSSAATDERVAREFEPALVACMQAKPGVDHA